MLFKLSIRNMKKSFKDYAIYFLTLVLGIAIFYMFNSLDSQEAMLQVSQSTRDMIQLMIQLLGMVSVFIAIVLGFLIVYANNFLVNRRKKRVWYIYATWNGKKANISYYSFRNYIDWNIIFSCWFIYWNICITIYVCIGSKAI